ncbi:MAG: hypothetical protein V3T70_02015, partial [Phycisphaerae bacterium]
AFRFVLVLAVLVTIGLAASASWWSGPLLARIHDPAGAAQAAEGGLDAFGRLAAAVIGLLILYFFLMSVMKGLRMYRALSLMELFHGGLFLGMAVIAFVTDRLSAYSLGVMYGGSLLAAAIVFGVGLTRTLRIHRGDTARLNDPAFLRRMLRFSVWATLAGFTWQALQYYPTWYLNRVHGHESAAVFIAVRQFGQFVLVAAAAVITVVLTQVTKTWEREGVAAADRQWSLSFRSLSLMLLLGCGLLTLIRHWLLGVYSPAYAVGADILPLQLLFFLLGANLAFLAIHFNLIEKTRHMFWPWAVGVATNMVLAYWLLGAPRARLEDSAIWHRLVALSDVVCVTGLAERIGDAGLEVGLRGASWAGVLAMTAALLTSLALLRLEGRPVDRGSRIVLCGAVLLVLKPSAMVIGLVVLTWLSLRTNAVFAAEERSVLFEHVRRVIGGFRRVR